MTESKKKLRIGWFSFSCCEDSTIMFTELLNDHYQEWMKVLDIRHARVLQTKNVMDHMHVAFIEGAIASPGQEEELKTIRENADAIVAIGACACTGMPSCQRNAFPPEVQEEIKFLLEKFDYGEKAKKLDEIVKVDATVPGCPMDEKKFLETVDWALKEFGIQ